MALSSLNMMMLQKDEFIVIFLLCLLFFSARLNLCFIDGGKNTMRKYLFLLGIVAFLSVAACETIYEKETVGIGPDYSELKKSPCACLELEQAPELPMWFS